MYSIQEETSLDAVLDCLELAQAHYEEVEAKASVIPYKVNFTHLKVAHEHGLIALVTVRDQGELVGYMANLVCEDFMTSQVSAKELGIYLNKSSRGGTTFFRMMMAMENLMRERGVAYQHIMFKEGHDSGMAERMGYTKTETVYQKLLEA
jgi:hypothetical protein